MTRWKRNSGDYKAKMVLSPERLEELSLWVANVDSCVRKITREEPHSILETDASLTGRGAKRGEVKTQGSDPGAKRVSILIAWSYFQSVGDYCLSVTQSTIYI